MRKNPKKELAGLDPFKSNPKFLPWLTDWSCHLEVGCTQSRMLDVSDPIMLLMVWLLHLNSKIIPWTMLTSLNTKFLRGLWKDRYAKWCSVLGVMEVLSRSRQYLARGKWTDAAISCCRWRISKQICHVRSPEVSRHKVWPWWRNIWFSISWAPSLDHRCSEKRDQKKVEKQFVYPKHIPQVIIEVCAVQWRPFSASDATSHTTLSTSELRKLYPDTVSWGERCYALHCYQLLHFTPRSFCNQCCSMFTSQPESRFVSAAKNQLRLPRQ